MRQGVMCAFLLLASCARTDLYFVNHARLAPPPAAGADPGALLVAGHQIESGPHLVLLLRTFEPGHWFTVDDERFDKLTIEVHSYRPRVPIDLPSPDVDLFYSSGSSGFVSKGAGVFSREAHGTLTIVDSDQDHTEVKLDLRISAQPASAAVPMHSREVVKRGQFRFASISPEKLTPWLGKPGLGREALRGAAYP